MATLFRLLSGARRGLVFTALTLLVVSGGQPQAAAPLTLEDLFASPDLFGTAPSAPEWSPDSSLFAFSWNDRGENRRDLWIGGSDGSALRCLAMSRQSVAEGSSSCGEGDAPSVRDIAWHPDGRQILALGGAQLWQILAKSGEVTPIAQLGSGVSELSVSPDGKRVAYLKDGDLWTMRLGESEPGAITSLGIAGLSKLSIGRYNRAEREIGPGIWGGPTYAWAPDSRTIAVHLVDRRGMRKVPFPDYLAPETDPNVIRRGYPGDANESRQVGLVNVTDGALSLLPLADPEANQVVGFSWSAQGELLLDIASDTAVDRWLYTVDPAEGKLRQIWHKQRQSRIYTAFAAAWHPNGEDVVFLSDLADRYGLYAISATDVDRTPRVLSDTNLDVLGAPAITQAGQIFYAANAPSPRESQVFRSDLSGAAPLRITHKPGYSTPYPSPDGRTVLFMHSNDSAPPELYLVSGAGGDAQRLTRSPLEEFSERSWARSRYVSFPSQIDDYRLHARILEPRELVPGRCYPVLFGPMYSNTVRDRWSGVYSKIQQLLVQKGYVVVQVDMRGSTGYGRGFREEFLVDFAGDDIEDIASAVEFLKTQPHLDTQRMGIWGSSYGGTLSVYTLLKKPGLFRAAVAAAAAVDPRFFGTDDVAIVRRPSTQPEVFGNVAARYAARLEDHLLIIHGMQDQVVPFKTTVVLAEELIRQGRDFDFAFAPGATHSWSREPYYAEYLFGKMLTHFDRYLQAPAEESPPPGSP